MPDTLDTGIRNSRNVSRYIYGRGARSDLKALLSSRREQATKGDVVFFVDGYFAGRGVPDGIDAVVDGDRIVHIDTTDEPTTLYVDHLRDQLVTEGHDQPCAIVGIGGGITMDIAKAVSNLLTNGGSASDYQGWDLVKRPGIYKIGMPTISGTGAEATRTCVMTNPENGLKLGMNSDYTVFDQLILDPELTATVPREHYFYSGMDAYIHCIESLAGGYRNAVGDAFSEETLKLCREVFLGEDMMNDENRERMMVASYLGGCAIANSYVGLVHPFSAGLSVVLKLHHGMANCITMRAMEEFYPEEYEEFWRMAEHQGIEIPEGICRDLSDEQYEALYNATVIHEKPLTNALGEGFRDVLTRERVIDLFKRM